MSSLDVFFSEYVEGSGNNKALEIYNGTTAPINLAASNYVIQTYFNGQTTPIQTFVLTGTVAAGDVYVIALDNGTLQAILDQADQTTTSQFGWYNGNDAIVLRKGGSGGQILDSIGQIGFDPGTQWGTGLISTEDNTLRRTRNVTDGDPNPNDTFDPSLQWQGFLQNTVGDLGSHYAAPVLNNSGFPTLTAINEEIPAASNTGTPVSTLISGLVTDINSDPQGIAVTGADNSNGAWQYSVNGGNSWTPFGAVSDTNATLLGWTSLYAGQLGTPPASQPWMALGNVNQANPFAGVVATQTLNGGSTTLNSLANQSIYAGYSTHTLGIPSLAFSPKNAAVPVLDRTLGYGVRFDVKINSESHSFADSDKNADGLSDRAGFSLIAISSDGQKGVEIGFWDNEIWVQKDGIADAGPLFTHDSANPSADRWFGDTTQLASYELTVLGENFTLFRNGTAILNNRPLRNYTSFTGAINPYQTPNFLFFGDDTTSASASFELKNVAVKSAEPRIRFVPNQDYFGTSPSLTFRAWDTTDNIASGRAGVNVAVNGSTSPFSSESETATITVNPVNDAPSFVKGADSSAIAGGGSQTVNNWATSISQGPPNESTQTVNFNLSNNNNTLFTVQPAIDAAGNLTYTPASGVSGIASVTATLSDNGGTANNGVDTSAAQTFTINITADTILPAASNLAAGNILVAGGTTKTFTVDYSDNVAVNSSSLDNSDIRVTGPNGFNQLATLVSFTPTGNGTLRTATYQITPPGGSWDLGENGDYAIAIESGQVSDINNNFVTASNLGSFNVNIPNPGTFNFSAANYQIGESGGFATITVTRTSNTNVAADISYSTSDGTANAGSDYTATSGTLNFAIGETSKNFTIPINDDTLVEGSEIVALSLNNPTNGASVGVQSTANLTILDNDVDPTPTPTPTPTPAETPTPTGTPTPAETPTPTPTPAETPTPTG
ncbi:MULTISPECIES: choice-of-anchor Y domain-containing protein, partial [unclassified Microcoleus]|uniref:choice-of-anchor Y domain-containing protein n=1 Tax=unclassified Microcoleus TaxID=2642155 RepID=UPI002FD34E5C